MDGRRIFLAIDISDAARTVCSSHIDALRTEFPQVRVGWERPEKLHITLKFLGPTSDETLVELDRRLTSVAARYRAFRLKLGASGSFPEKGKPRVLWIGIDEATDDLRRLQNEVEQVCVSLDYEPEDKSFHPHITIGRVRDPRDSLAVVEAHRATPIEAVEFEVRSVAIYESKLLPTGSVYSKISMLSLTASPAKQVSLGTPADNCGMADATGTQASPPAMSAKHEKRD
ncbi:MAG: RNA 2',3'-cyclic phosphodiesterase [Acidobacteria bacterium]|nr:MAG: RNA 2',3'-cyclic phosphodiesterase [Acidobacteriota bacterium]